MNRTSNQTTVPPEEVERRIAEYRRLGFEHQAPAHVVYHDPHQLCPWPGCGYRIAGIAFQLEKMGDEAYHKQLLASWWQGPGLIGRCPGCLQPVLFALTAKQMVNDPGEFSASVLPDDWHKIAHLVGPSSGEWRKGCRSASN